MPVPNKGMQAAATAMITVAVRVLERALTALGATSEEGKEVMKALTALSKIAPPGSGSPGVEQSALQNLMAQQKQDAPMLQMLRQRGMAPGGGAPGGAPPTPTPAAA